MKTMNRLLLTTAVSLAALSMSARVQAADLSYTWLEGGLMRITPGTTDIKTPFTSPTISGKYIDGSWGLSDNIALSAGYDYAKQGGVTTCMPSDCRPTTSNGLMIVALNHDMHELSTGATYHADLSESLQWLASLDYLHATYYTLVDKGVLCAPGVPCPQFAQGPGPSNATAVGYDLSAGLRWRPLDSWEFDGRLGRRSMSAGPQTPLDEGTDFGLGDGSADFVEAAAMFDLTTHWALRLDVIHVSTPHTRYLLGIRYSF